MQLTSSFLSHAAAARVSGPSVVFEGIATDSRKSCANQLFVALKGENFDGHAYVQRAIEQGATGVLVSQEVSLPPSVCKLVVNDTLVALQQLGKAQRERFSGRVIGITGSNGKTSTKQMTASVMAAEYGADAVLATVGSLNNHIGVPLTLLRLTSSHRVAVIEMGMNHFHELSLLTSLAKPDVAAITNAGPAHLEGVGSLLGVAKAKGEIFEGLRNTGTAVINADDAFAAYWRVITRDKNQLLFGFSQDADLRGEHLSDDRLAVHGYNESSDPLRIAVALPGRHNQMNALAVAAMAKAIGVSADALVSGLQSATNVEGRLGQTKLQNGVTLIDDAYNANPASIRAACAILEALPAPRVLVLGDMAELGDDALAHHRELAEYIASRPIDQVLTLGDRFGAVTAAFSGKATHFKDRDALHAELAKRCVPGASILAKGANSMQMGRAIAYLKEKYREMA